MKTVRTTWAALQTLGVAVGLVIAGCSAPEPTSPDAELAEVNPPRPLELKPGADRIETNSLYSLYLTEGVRNVCAGPAPFFGYGSVNTKTASLPTMQTLANCMVDGPLAGKSIELVGHTDPRGSQPFNEELGLARAKRVKQYLTNNGVHPARITIATEGETWASKDANNWPLDRRVEVRLTD